MRARPTQDATVVGSGIIGFTTALSLLHAGLTVRLVAAGPLESTTSWKAAAAWFPTYIGHTASVTRWSHDTYDALARQASRGVPGVVMQNTLTLYRTAPRPPSWASMVRDIRPATKTELPAHYDHGLLFTAPFVEMPTYLQWLAAQVDHQGGAFETQHLDSLAELLHGPTAPDVIVNCSGLGAHTLVPDKTLFPIRGQIIRVTNPGVRTSVRDEHHPEGRAYVHPRSRDCILGGTAERGNWDTQADPQTAAAIMTRCRGLVPELADASVIEHVVGLRPGCPTVRLDETNLHGTRVIHNYGHGGSGITLSWGCARQVTDMITRTAASP